jgi:hypothetical protein
MTMLIGWLLLTWSIAIFLILVLGWEFSAKEKFLMCVGFCLLLLAISVGAFLITGGK